MMAPGRRLGRTGLVIRIISLGLVLSLGAVLWAQSTQTEILSTPTGPFGIGRITYHWTTCPTRGCPLLIFSHGGGVDRSFYSSQYEDLASNGYIVAVIAHTYDTHVVVFPDGRVVGAAPAFRDSRRSDSTLPRWRREWQNELRSQAYLRRVIDVEARDIRFVIDQLSRYARDARLRAPFLRRVNLERIGALGHSAGGEAAALACQIDARLKACLDQDGVMHNLPFFRDVAGRTMSQPFRSEERRV